MNIDLKGRDPRLWQVTRASSIKQFFNLLGKSAIYFAGYGELGYEEEGAVRRIAHEVLKSLPPSNVVVHAGTLLRLGGQHGIAEVYTLAKEFGIETTGIHPSVAMNFADTHRVSPHCDHVFFIEDDTWGGFPTGDDIPSPTLSLHLDVSDELVMIGGGRHAAHELKAFISKGKPVRFFPADSNHRVTRQWFEHAGIKMQDLRGEAHLFWDSIRHL